MTRDEVKQILMRIQVTYPNWKPSGDIGLVVDVWHEYLVDYEYKQILAAVKSYVVSDTTGFAPTVGQVLAKLKVITEPEAMSELEAWARVSKALRNGLYGSESEFDKLPEMVRKAVGCPENLRNWAMTEEKVLESVVMSQFLTAYRTVLKREREVAAIPHSLRIAMSDRLAIDTKQ